MGNSKTRSTRFALIPSKDPLESVWKWSAEEEDAWARRRATHGEQHAHAVLVLEAWATGYQQGQIPVTVMCKGLIAAIEVLPDDFGWEVVGGRERLLGHWIRRAMSIPPPPGKSPRVNSTPDAIKAMAAFWVGVMGIRGLSLSQGRADGTKTAFEWVANHLRGIGVRGVSPKKVEGWYYEQRDARKSGKP